MLKLERIAPQDVNWESLDSRPDRVVFQTREWLEFVARTQHAEPVIARVRDSGETVGYFTGLITTRYGIRILGSPFPGWTTESMGFNLRPGVSHEAAADALRRFAFGPLRCLHLELKDRQMGDVCLSHLGFESTATLTFLADLTADESVLFGRMSSACRRAIRKAEKSGVTVEVAGDDSFADDYYRQLQDVFAKQSLVPTYGIDRVRELITCLGPTGRLLPLRALGPDGSCVATAIFVAFNATGYFWGGASFRADQALRPNEFLMWHAMRDLRARGVTSLDLGGAGEYKRKYGVEELWLPWFRRSRFAGLSSIRDGAKAVAQWRQRRLGSGPVAPTRP